MFGATPVMQIMSNGPRSFEREQVAQSVWQDYSINDVLIIIYTINSAVVHSQITRIIYVLVR